GPKVLDAKVDLALTYYFLSFLQRMTGSAADAVQSCGRAAKLREELLNSNPTDWVNRTSLVMIYQVMSGYQDQDGDTSGALKTIGRAIALSEENLALWRPEEHDGRGLVAYCLETAAGIRLSARQPDEAIASAHRAVALREDLFRDRPGDQTRVANL